MLRLMIQSINHCLQHFLPNYCLQCLQPTGTTLALCEFCIQQLPTRQDHYCQICALPLIGSGACGQCIKDPPAFHHITSAFEYRAPIDRFLLKLKFSNQLIYAHIFGILLARHIMTCLQTPLPQAIIPFPCI